MRTTKCVSTISYNTEKFLQTKLFELLELHKISDFMYIVHLPEEDEKKRHIHLFIKPNTLIDTMDLQNYLTEVDLNNPLKPLKCIDFRFTKDIDDWILYNQHYPPYLATKFESRKYTYDKSDFKFADEDTFDDYYLHAFKGSKFAQNNQILKAIANKDIKPSELINNGTVPLNMASQLSAYMYLESHYNITDRGGRMGHE